MSDTSTPEYYQQMQQTNQQLLSQGVSSIALDQIDWGTINVDGTSATAVDYETWTTIYSDSTTEESRDENDYSLVQQNGSWLIQADSQPNGGGGERGARVATPSPATPAPLPANAPTAAASNPSSNWAGYASTSGPFTSLSGTWSIPQFAPASPTGMDATWVGIGGVKSRDLIQAGTQQQTSGSGQTLYSAWVEALPQQSQPVPLTIRAGDSVTVSLTEQSPGTWQVTFANNTTGQNFQTNGQYQSSHSSAEWIQEAPSAARGGVMPIDAFGTVSFSGLSAVTDGQQVTLAQTDPQAIDLETADGQALVVTSAVGGDGQSFDVTRTDVPDAQPGGRRSGRPGA